MKTTDLDNLLTGFLTYRYSVHVGKRQVLLIEQTT